jgi:predicted ester cyclase
LSTKAKDIVLKYYDMWNSQNFDVAENIFDNSISFHGSIGIDTNGIEEFKKYALDILSAFPNLYHAPEMIVSEEKQVAVYVSYSGTHKGKLLEYKPTNNRINYEGASFFTIKENKIVDIKVLGDRYSLYNQIGGNQC